MEDNPTKYYEKQFLLSALSPVANLGCLPGSFKVWCSHHDFQKKNIQKIVCLKKASRTQTFYLGQCQAFEKTCHCSSLTCLTMPKEGLLLFPAVMHSTKQNLPPGNRPWNLIQAHLPLWWGCSKPAEGLCKQSEWVTFQWVWQLLPR